MSSDELRPTLLISASLALALALATVVAPRPAAACGPDFPPSLLLDRGDTLGTLPDGWFLEEVSYLVQPAHAYPYVADAGPTPADAGTRERALYEAGDYAGVLALPAAQRRHRSTWAAYMLGRTRSGAAAIAAYRQVRALVDAGFEDPAGLAASSLGQEARVHLWQHEPVAAIRLYAEQAALGHPDGATSLLYVVRDLVTDGRERALLGDPVGQRLLATYLETRGQELTAAQGDRLWDELVAIDRLEGADQLAALAYQRGEWARAEALLRTAGSTPLARWVAAKLALRAGDTTAGERLLAEAAEGYRARAACPAPDAGAAPADADTDVSEDQYIHAGTLRERIVGERVTLAVEDGRMTDALALAYQIRTVNPDDLDYVAERLVSLDELIAFVDALPGADQAADHADWEASPAALRALLGRRLMRAGRYAQAIPYLGPSVRVPALGYALAMTRAALFDDPIDRAHALYDASRYARRNGLEILGTAHAPDWEFYGAQYDRFAWEEPSWFRGRTVGELARAAVSAPAYGERYHYRYLAAALGEQAADLLPHRSQAFSATLCWAGRYIRHDDPGHMEDLYARYLRQGAAVSMAFPDDCPEPEFAEARHPQAAPPRRTPARPTVSLPRALAHRVFGHGRAARRHAYGAAAALIGLTALALSIVAWRRRWRRFAPRA